MLLYACKEWSFLARDVRRSEFFHYLLLSVVARFGSSGHLSSDTIRNLVLNTGSENALL